MNVLVFGSRGYSGVELIKYLLCHPKVDAITCHSHSMANKALPPWLLEHSYSTYASKFTKTHYVSELDTDLLNSIDTVFSALPHGVAHTIIAPLLETYPNLRLCIDLSRDYRMYEHSLHARVPAYGLSEWNRSALQNARFITNPGCYATAGLLALLPLLRYEKNQNPISIVALSGVSGAGKSSSATTHFVERAENVLAYKSGTTHPHHAEILYYCKRFSYAEPELLFSPVMIPIRRGIALFFNLQYESDTQIKRAIEGLKSQYLSEQFVKVQAQDDARSPLSEVVGTNDCIITYAQSGTHLLIASYIDNLVKGAAGQAIQNFNIANGFDEYLGLQ